MPMNEGWLGVQTMAHYVLQYIRKRFYNINVPSAPAYLLYTGII